MPKVTFHLQEKEMSLVLVRTVGPGSRPSKPRPPTVPIPPRPPPRQGILPEVRVYLHGNVPKIALFSLAKEPAMLQAP